MQCKTNAQVRRGASQVVNSVNNTPTYIMRKLNKLATGRDSDFNDLVKEGVSKEDVCEQYNRLQEAANVGGYWWGSIIARQGYCITGARVVSFAEGDENNEDVKPLYVAKGDILITEVINGTLYTLRAASVWSYANVIASAALFLKFKEEAARKAGALYSWQKVQDTAKAQAKEARKEAAKAARKAASEARKEEARKAREVAKAVQELRARGSRLPAFSTFSRVITRPG